MDRQKGEARWSMNLPKTIVICGKTFFLLLNDNKNGGECDVSRCEITIGTGNPQDTLYILYHEIMEAILVERNMRYALEIEQPDNGDYIFSFSHKEFECAMNDFVYAIRDIDKNQ